MVPCLPLLGLTPSGLFMGLSSTLIYTSELILCSTICVPSATRHNIHFENRRGDGPGDEVADDGYFFVFPFGIEGHRCVFSLSTLLEPLTKRTDLGNREFRL